MRNRYLMWWNAIQATANTLWRERFACEVFILRNELPMFLTEEGRTAYLDMESMHEYDRYYPPGDYSNGQVALLKAGGKI